MNNNKNKIYQWLDDRLKIDGLVKYLSKKTVPLGYGYISDLRKHELSYLRIAYQASKRPYIWYYFGGLTLFLFSILVITGMLLLLNYKNGVDTAHESVIYIMEEVPFGWLIRSLHSWAANMMIVSAFIHMFSVFFQKSYRKPRELTWLTGFLLLFLCMFEGFTGYVLPWSKLSYFGVKIVAELTQVIPFIGNFLKNVLLAGDDVGPATLNRFLGLHVTIVPIIIFALIALHLIFIQRQGMARYFFEKNEKKFLDKINVKLPYRTMPFFPNFFLRDVIVWIIAFNILIVLASLFPWEVGEKADPLISAPSNLKPEWWFLAIFVILELVPKEIGLLFVAIIASLWIIVPFIDLKSQRNQFSIPIFMFGLIVCVGFTSFTLIGIIFSTDDISYYWHLILNFIF